MLNALDHAVWRPHQRPPADRDRHAILGAGDEKARGHGPSRARLVVGGSVRAQRLPTGWKWSPNRGHALTIDHGWHEVAQTALDFVKRFT
jgi:hypothetical protein